MELASFRHQLTFTSTWLVFINHQTFFLAGLKDPMKHCVYPVDTETNSNGNLTLSMMPHLLSVRAATVFHYTSAHNNPLSGSIWTVTSRGERSRKQKGEYCQEEKPQRGERRCKRKGEKSRETGIGDAERKCENHPIYSFSIINQFIC